MLLTPDQRNEYYLMEAEYLGIHKPILAALYGVHQSPSLSDGEKGLGVFPMGAIDWEQLKTFPAQVQLAANVINIIIAQLIDQGWKAEDLWDVNSGRYQDQVIAVIADGYTPRQEEPQLPLLKPCDRKLLLKAYLGDLEKDYQELPTPINFQELEPVLLKLVERIPQYYLGLSHQKFALLELVRIWRKLNSPEEVKLSFQQEQDHPEKELTALELEELLKDFAQKINNFYSGYPHQREALIRLIQLWRKQPTRAETLISLSINSSAQEDLSFLDPALIAFIQKIPKLYEGKGQQRNALVEGIRIWRKLDSRSAVLSSLGLNIDLINLEKEPEILKNVAQQIDQELIAFLRRIPGAYQEIPHQRQALLSIVQLWHNFTTPKETLAFLTENLKKFEQGPIPEEMKPLPLFTLPRPSQWSPYNLQLSAPIIPNGSLIWAQATLGGTRMPPNQKTVEAMIRIATLAQKVIEQLQQPLIITSWYRPPQINRAVGGSKFSRHLMGDAIDFVCENLSGSQIYWALEPWFPGGLGRYRNYPHLCHIDARNYRARWISE